MAKSISTSPKISVEGDYDSYARRPRKKKKLKLHEVGETASDALVLESGMDEITKADQNGHTGMKRLGTSDSIELELPITTFPNKKDEKAKQIPVLYDSLPTRKQAKVEFMKQTRREISAEKMTCQNSNRENLTELQNRKQHTNQSPSPTTRRSSHSPMKDKGEKSSSSRRTGEVHERSRHDNSLHFREPFTSNSRSLIKAMVVRSLLPPIKSSKMEHLFTNSEEANKHNVSHLEVTNKSFDASSPHINSFTSLDMKYHFRRGSRLRQGSTKYVYRPNSNHTRDLKQNQYIGIVDNFHGFVRLRSKGRYLGKASFHNRAPSPTLGEEALEKKLTDRLPTRQIGQHPPHHNLYSESLDYHESWRRPPSNTYPKGIVLTAAENRGNSSLHPPYETSFWRRTILTRVPQHRIPVHKARALRN